MAKSKYSTDNVKEGREYTAFYAPLESLKTGELVLTPEVFATIPKVEPDIQYDVDRRLELAVASLTRSNTEAAIHSNITPTQQQYILNSLTPAARELVEQTKLPLLEMFQAEIAECWARLGTKREEASYKDLVHCLALLFDKTRLLQGESTRNMAVRLDATTDFDDIVQQIFKKAGHASRTKMDVHIHHSYGSDAIEAQEAPIDAEFNDLSD